MRTVCAIYDDPETAQRGYEALARCGLSATDITVMSSEPLHEAACGRDEGGTWMPWLAVFAAAVGGACGFWLTRTAQSSWPLQTGGMPIVTVPTNAIIIYELTMLGAIVGTFATFLVSAGLPSRRPRLYDPAVSEGKILVAVTNPGAISPDDLARRLRDTGPERVKTMEL